MIQLPVQQLVEEVVHFQDKVVQDQGEVCNTAVPRPCTILLI